MKKLDKVEAISELKKSGTAASVNSRPSLARRTPKRAPAINEIGSIGARLKECVQVRTAKDCCGDSSRAEHRSNQTGDGGSTPTLPLDFRIGEWQAAKHLVLQFHYSHRVRVACVTGTFHRTDRNGQCIAACFFSPPTARWREGQGMLELSRLVRAPRQCVPLTRLISLTVAEVRRRGIADLLISYADAINGHHGGVYQAAGWKYHGLRMPYRDGLIVRGRFVPSRTANARWGTNSPRRLRKMGIRAIAHLDKGKHLYWRPITAEGIAKAARIGLLDQPYPKPQPSLIGRVRKFG